MKGPHRNEQLQVKLFALARQLASQDVIVVQAPPEPTVAQLRSAIAEQYPALAQLSRHVAFAVDAEYANDAMKIPPGAEIACIPPVSGG